MEQNSSMADTGVHLGRDGYLFLSGGHHGVFSYFTGDHDPTPGSPEVFLANMEGRAKYYDHTDRVFRMVVFPEKCVALQSKVMIDADFTSLYERCYADLIKGSTFADRMRYPLLQLNEKTAAFSLTDTHYAALGNLAVTRSIVADLFPGSAEAGFATIEGRICKKTQVCGDLGRKFDPPYIEDTLGMNGRPVPVTMASNGVKGGNDGICVLVSSPEALSDKTLLIYGDSFFRQILPMLAVFYRRIIFCRTRFFHYEMIEGFKPDHVFCGLAERYLSGCLPDSARPNFLSYPFLLGRPTAPDPDFPALWKDFVEREALI